METQQAKVAVLLATYNGARFIEPQLGSLQANATPFSLHWLDDHSTDDTREAVRSIARRLDIDLIECHQPQRLGVPGAYFQLVECVDADIYLFCDQDDVWQPGKIDATRANLLPDIAAPALCYSDCLMFENDQPDVLLPVSQVLGIQGEAALQDSRSFMSIPAAGHTIGFTRPLRELFLRHKDIAHSYAFMHDWWMYIIAHASGTARMLSNVPTTLYRQHGNNATGPYFNRSSKGLDLITSTWRLQQHLRRGLSRQAQGFVLASATLPQGSKLERLIAIAQLVATVDRRQSLAAFIRLARRRALWPNLARSAWLAAACLSSDAVPG